MPSRYLLVDMLHKLAATCSIVFCICHKRKLMLCTFLIVTDIAMAVCIRHSLYAALLQLYSRYLVEGVSCSKCKGVSFKRYCRSPHAQPMHAGIGPGIAFMLMCLEQDTNTRNIQ